MSDDDLFQTAQSGSTEARDELFGRLSGPVLRRTKDEQSDRWWVRVPKRQYRAELISAGGREWTGAGIVSSTLLSVLWFSIVYMTTEPPVRPSRRQDRAAASQDVRDHWRVARNFSKHADWRKTIRNELNRAVKRLVISDSDYPGLGKRQELEPQWSARANREMTP